MKNDHKKTNYHIFLPGYQNAFIKSHSPILSYLLFSVVGLLIFLFAYLYFAKVEQVVVAQGIVRPEGNNKIINVPEQGVVKKIHVAEGQEVKYGQVLLELDATHFNQELQRLQHEIVSNNFEIERLVSEVNEKKFVPNIEEIERYPGLFQLQSTLFVERQELISSRLKEAGSIVLKEKSRVEALYKRIDRLGENLSFLKDQEKSLKQLAGKGYFPKLKYLKLQGDITDKQGEISETQSQLEGAKAAYKEAKEKVELIKKDWKTKLLNTLKDSQEKQKRAETNYKLLQKKIESMTLKSPVHGKVHNLSVHSLGQSLNIHQPVLQIVPSENNLIIEGQVQNHEIAKVELGQTVRVRVLTYDFVKYGELEGTVTRVGSDVQMGQQGQTPYYPVTVQTSQDFLGQTENKNPILPGMIVELNFLAGKRSILSYLTDRLVSVSRNSFREH